MTDFSHLNAIQARLHRETQRLAEARTETERAARAVWVAQAEKELADEYKFLGVEPGADFVGSDDELLAELEG
jgi:hypothetical protein